MMTHSAFFNLKNALAAAGLLALTGFNPAFASSHTQAANAQPALSEQQIQLAAHVRTGTVQCDGDTTVTLAPSTTRPGYFALTVQNGGKTTAQHSVAPQATASGAVRLETRRGGVVWLYLANKSMLMDESRGRRVADNCRDDAQKAIEEQLTRDPSKAEFK